MREPMFTGTLQVSVAVGEMQWKVVEPLDDDSVYARFLAEHGPGVHHVGVAAPDHEGTLAELAPGRDQQPDRVYP